MKRKKLFSTCQDCEIVKFVCFSWKYWKPSRQVHWFSWTNFKIPNVFKFRFLENEASSKETQFYIFHIYIFLSSAEFKYSRRNKLQIWFSRKWKNFVSLNLSDIYIYIYIFSHRESVRSIQETPCISKSLTSETRFRAFVLLFNLWFKGEKMKDLNLRTDHAPIA